MTVNLLLLLNRLPTLERFGGGLYDNDVYLLFAMQPELRRDYPLNLSISFSGGKETNKDSFSNGE